MYFSPQPDITAHELAMILMHIPQMPFDAMQSTLRTRAITFENWGGVPDSIKRHFTTQPMPSVAVG